MNWFVLKQLLICYTNKGTHKYRLLYGYIWVKSTF